MSGTSLYSCDNTRCHQAYPSLKQQRYYQQRQVPSDIMFSVLWGLHYELPRASRVLGASILLWWGASHNIPPRGR